MIELITENEPGVTRRLVELETEAFGAGGMNEWHLVPLIRHGRVFAFRKDGEIIGAIQYLLDWNDRNKAYVVGISIAKEWRGRSFGTELLAKSLKVLSQEGIAAVELTVDPNNAAAIKVYRDKLGFKDIGSLTDEYGSGEDRLVMKKTFAASAPA
ncbi:GNAT family N-acetyltransferase [Anaeroselena agilis]|uniref:GNAT family N-acetyltransferase n=1 Tax=Anaeroselena agilis TaxID=3063788 RepID=A0ABU3NSS8_9FIRM|nr:GNAT family N-acetyltransferase [Selenomonadales bacterium 4137-cl]